MPSSNKQWGLWHLTAQLVLLKRKRRKKLSFLVNLASCFAYVVHHKIVLAHWTTYWQAGCLLKIIFFINYFRKVPLSLYWLLIIFFSSAIMAHINPEQSTVTIWRLLRIILLIKFENIFCSSPKTLLSLVITFSSLFIQFSPCPPPPTAWEGKMSGWYWWLRILMILILMIKDIDDIHIDDWGYWWYW